MGTFKKLGLSDNILRALDDLGFEEPTEIQAEAIPKLLEKSTDLIGLAQTGTGKTAAFGLPILELVDPDNNDTQALVLAPTRELGKQIAEELHKFSKYIKKLKVLPVYGGAAIVNQIRDLKKGQQVVIATPGRLIDLIKRKAVRLDNLKYLVLDEADEMLNMGFKEELDKILSYTPDDKSTWLFSATMPDFIKKIVSTYMSNPIEIRINSKDKVNKNIEHQFAIVKRSDKEEALKRFLDIQKDMRGVVFCRTKRETQAVAEKLLTQNYKADALHGDLTQGQRDRVMKRFKTHELQVLIATDVAARGIDVDDLTHVFHFDLPDDMAYYTHRSGRTARAGKKGISMVFIGGRDHGKIRRLQKVLGIEFTQATVPNTEVIAEIRLEDWCKDILKQKPKGNLNPELISKASAIFENLTKEELMAKVLMYEFKQMNIGRGNDLNESLKEGGGRDRGGRDRGGSDRPRKGRDARIARGRGGSRRRSDDSKGGSSRNKNRDGDKRKSGGKKRRP